MNTDKTKQTVRALPEKARDNDGIRYGVAIDGQTGRFVRYTDERCNPVNGRQFNGEYPRFIDTAQLTPDGLFWTIWDRLNNVQVSRMNEHGTVNMFSTFLNETWNSQESPQFQTWEAK